MRVDGAAGKQWIGVGVATIYDMLIKGLPSAKTNPSNFFMWGVGKLSI